ncbi:MAG: hypothetical protein R3B82_14995 [Sandaracinaceae bacterium]
MDRPTASRLSRLGVWLCAASLTACGEEPPPRSAPSTLETPPPAAEPPAAPAADAMPDGFLPIVLGPSDDDCDGPSVYVGPSAVVRAPALEAPPPPDERLPAGVAREVAAAMAPAGGAIGVLRTMGGGVRRTGREPLFRWHRAHAQRPVLFVDRRVARGRLLEALRGANDGVPLRLGGVDEGGLRACVLALVDEPADLDAQPENTRYDASIEASGGLTVGGAPVERGAPLPSEGAEGLHVVRFDVPADVDATTLVRALAAARWAERRYGWLVLP